MKITIICQQRGASELCYSRASRAAIDWGTAIEAIGSVG